MASETSPTLRTLLQDVPDNSAMAHLDVEPTNSAAAVPTPALGLSLPPEVRYHVHARRTLEPCSMAMLSWPQLSPLPWHHMRRLRPTWYVHKVIKNA